VRLRADHKGALVRPAAQVVPEAHAEGAVAEHLDGEAVRRSARERLERLHERFTGKGEARAQLEALSALLAQAADRIRAGRSAPDLSGQLAQLGVALVREEERSLYNPAALRAALDP
jgi:hypothetical protein